MKVLLGSATKMITDREWTWTTDLMEIKSLYENAGHEVRLVSHPDFVKEKNYDTLIVINDYYSDWYAKMHKEVIPYYQESFVNLIKEFQKVGKPVGLVYIDPEINFQTKSKLEWKPDYLLGKCASRQWIESYDNSLSNLPSLHTQEAFQELFINNRKLKFRMDFDFDIAYGGTYREERSDLLDNIVHPAINNPEWNTALYGHIASSEKFKNVNSDIINFIEPSKILDFIDNQKYDIIVSEDKFNVGPKYVTPRLVMSLLSASCTLVHENVSWKDLPTLEFSNYDDLEVLIDDLPIDNRNRFAIRQYFYVADHDFENDYRELNKFMEKILLT